MVYYCFTHITQALETENIGGAIWAYWSARLSGPGRHQDLKCFDCYLSNPLVVQIHSYRLVRFQHRTQTQFWWHPATGNHTHRYSKCHVRIRGVPSPPAKLLKMLMPPCSFQNGWVKRWTLIGKYTVIYMDQRGFTANCRLPCATGHIDIFWNHQPAHCLALHMKTWLTPSAQQKYAEQLFKENLPEAI